MNNGKIIICTLDCRHLVELIEIYSRIDLTDSLEKCHRTKLAITKVKKVVE